MRLSAPFATLLFLGAALGLAFAFGAQPFARAETAVRLDPPAMPAPRGEGLQTIVLAGGCFWGVQAVYQHLNGVTNAVSGYAGGTPGDANYNAVSSGRSRHAEAVKVTFDPAVVSLGDILQVFFSVAHNPTELNRQGPDTGAQYRSEIFVQDDAQRDFARAYVGQLDAAKAFARPIVTVIGAARAEFYPAEAYHQDYAAKNPTQPYIAIHDAPKVRNLAALFPTLYRAKPVLVAEAGR
jgi:peptide-methionine (S)-S-oxide reductase